jgi:hypothetical protein
VVQALAADSADQPLDVRTLARGARGAPSDFWMPSPFSCLVKSENAWLFLNQRRYALHDRDTKFCSAFRATLAAVV